MSSISSDFTKVSRTNRRKKSKKFHYNHGIPGIPYDGKVVLLNNSNTGSQLYLVGTLHDSKQSAETVKKVINYVRPDSVAIELSIQLAWKILESVYEDDDLYTVYLMSRIVPGGLLVKIVYFIRQCWRLWNRDTYTSRLDMEVAMKESSRVGAEAFFIDKDEDVFYAELANLETSDEVLNFQTSDEFEFRYYEYCKYLRRSNYNNQLKNRRNLYTRALRREYYRYQKEAFPARFKLLMQDRDELMFTKVREMEGKVIVAVVGQAHMDGIEQLWKHAEDSVVQHQKKRIRKNNIPSLDLNNADQVLHTTNSNHRNYFLSVISFLSDKSLLKLFSNFRHCLKL